MFQVNWNREICLKCLTCVNNCPNENLTEFQGYPVPAELNTCQGCGYCVQRCPVKGISVSPLASSLAYNLWSPLIRQQIYQMSKSGNYLVEGAGAKRRVPNMDDLIFLPAQLARFPLLEEEEVNTKIILGKYAKRPVYLDIPLLIGEMSFGALSLEAKVALAKASKMAGTIDNSGEGGLLPEARKEARYYTLQYSTGRFGISEETLKQADMIEIKISQGAKPGVGGHLLKNKITEDIARIRNIPMGKDAISPARHKDIKSKEDLKERVEYLREITGGVPIAIKIAGGHVEEDLEVISFVEPDVLVIDGMEGGTGAAPIIAKEHAGIPTLHLLSRTKRYLEEKGIKDKLTLIVSGGLRTAVDFAKALALGANGVYIGTAALIAMGCIYCRACSKGNCPKGICTQDLRLRKRLDIYLAAKNVANFLKGSVKEMVMLARLVGKNDLQKLSIEDLGALNEEAARITGVKLI